MSLKKRAYIPTLVPEKEGKTLISIKKSQIASRQHGFHKIHSNANKKNEKRGKKSRQTYVYYVIV